MARSMNEIITELLPSFRNITEWRQWNRLFPSVCQYTVVLTHT